MKVIIDNHYLLMTILMASLLMSSNALSNTLDFECDTPLSPKNIDCPDDEFFSIGVYPGYNIINPEQYSGLYQWSADYMNFARGWYYSKGTTRVGVFDTALDTSVSDFDLPRFRGFSSGGFPTQEDSAAGLTFSFNVDGSIHHGTMVTSLLLSETDNSAGMASYCRDCTIGFTIANTGRYPVSYDANQPPSIDLDTFTLFDSVFHQANKSLEFLVATGNQVLNFSNQFTMELSYRYIK